MKQLFTFFFFIYTAFAAAQSWPASAWASAANLTPVMDAGGVTDLSGLHFNPVNNRLYAVQGDGHLRVLQWNAATNTFSQLTSKTISGGPEGITQANLNANEFYTIDENNYEIRRYTHAANFSSVTLYKHWNLLASPSPMANTGNTGPEGIVFIPDSFLAAAGFVSQQTGQPYTSVKGLGGLFFIAHQDEGMIWVFDVNPNANDDFTYVGKYRTNRAESCELSFDRSTGLMYILHNISPNNRLEVTDLSTMLAAGNERKFVMSAEYALAYAGDGNDNIEGFAMMPKCPENGISGAWLCRDVENSEDTAIQQDALRFFSPFVGSGTCTPLATDEVAAVDYSVYPNPALDRFYINGLQENASINVFNLQGQLVLSQQLNQGESPIAISTLASDIYIVEIQNSTTVSKIKLVKQ